MKKARGTAVLPVVPRCILRVHFLTKSDSNYIMKFD